MSLKMSLKMSPKPSILLVLSLIAANFIFATHALCAKMAALSEPLSVEYFAWLAGLVFILGVYAIIWQQILQRTTLSFAYMFKGTSLIFTLILVALIFGEQITLSNIIGTILIVTGIVLYSKA